MSDSCRYAKMWKRLRIRLEAAKNAGARKRSVHAIRLMREIEAEYEHRDFVAVLLELFAESRESGMNLPTMRQRIADRLMAEGVADPFAPAPSKPVESGEAQQHYESKTMTQSMILNAHMVNVRIRIGGEWVEREADWLKELLSRPTQPVQGEGETVTKHDCEKWHEEGAGCAICRFSGRMTVEEIKAVQEHSNWIITTLKEEIEELRRSRPLSVHTGMGETR